MSYTINLTNGNLLVTVPDGTINTTACSQTLVGKNYAGYGQFLDDNFVHLLENAANATQPTTPLTGQLWFNTTTGVLQVYNGVGFKSLGSAQAASSAPSNNSIGDLWYDTVNAQLNVWTGSAWLLVGPIYNSTTGVTGAIPATILDNTSSSHIVVQLYVNNVIVGIISKDAAFTPQTSITGFTTVRPGITLATVTGSQVPLFQGTATNAQALGNVSASSFMRSDSNTSTSGSITVNSSGTPVALINAAGSAVGNIGSSAVPFNTVFATATSAQYSDLAETYVADDSYASGTLVIFGGADEITASTVSHDTRVAGIISTDPAYLMNSGAIGLPVALTGRVPCSVVGTIRKGDRLVASTIKGVATALDTTKYLPGCIIGKALENYDSDSTGVIEVAVGRY